MVEKERLQSSFKACIVLQNMIVKDEIARYVSDLERQGNDLRLVEHNLCDINAFILRH